MGFLSNFFLVSGVGLFCLGTALFYRQMTFIRHSKTGVGRVIDYERHETKSSCFHPIVEFKTAKNQKVIFKSGVASNKKRYEIGVEVPIRYVPQRPEVAEINKTWIIWFEIPLCFAFAFVLLWLALG